jgi:hypothetical protein
VNHLLKNLSYFDSKGRLQLLETLGNLIDKMPVTKLENYSEVIFLTLFLRLANESDSKCRTLVSQTIRKLVAKSKKNFSETVLAMSSDSAVLINGKLQLLSLFADIGKLTKNDIAQTVAFCAENLNEAATQKEDDDYMFEREPEKD